MSKKPIKSKIKTKKIYICTTKVNNVIEMSFSDRGLNLEHAEAPRDDQPRGQNSGTDFVLNDPP